MYHRGVIDLSKPKSISDSVCFTRKSETSSTDMVTITCYDIGFPVSLLKLLTANSLLTEWTESIKNRKVLQIGITCKNCKQKQVCWQISDSCFLMNF